MLSWEPALDNAQVLLLGVPAVVGADGSSIELQRLQARLLSVLALKEGRSVSADVAIEALWASPPTSSRASLRGHVKRLRQALDDPEGELLRTTPGGYALAAVTDIQLFDQLAGQCEGALADSSWQVLHDITARAVELWRSRPFESCEDVHGAQEEIDRLERRRLRVEGLHARGLIELGDHVAATAILQRQIAQHPSNEGLTLLQMRALAGAGNRSGALEEFARLESQLQRDLGTLPGSELTRLADSIAQSPTKPGRPPLANPFLSDQGGSRASFVGRKTELRSAFHALAHDSESRRLVLVEGPAGVGKSYLLSEIGRQFGSVPDSTVLAASATSSRLSFGTFSAMIASTEAHCEVDPFAAIRPELGRLFGRIMETDVVSEDVRLLSSRWREDLFEAFSRWVAGQGAVVLFIDDLQWIDPDSLDLLRHIWSHPQVADLRLLASRRSGDANVCSVLDPWLAEVAAAGELKSIVLGSMNAQELRDLIPDFDGTDAELMDLTGGSPLLAWAWAKRGGTQSPAETDALSAIVAGWLERLGKDGRDVAHAAAALGSEFLLGEVRKLLESDARFVDGFSTCLRAGLLAEQPDTTRASFVHSLIHGEIRSSLSDLEVASIHLRLFEAEEGGDAERRAHHAMQARLLIGDRLAITALSQAGCQAHERLAWGQAAEYFEQALELQSETQALDREDACHLLVTFAELLVHIDESRSTALLADASAAARKLGDIEIAARLADVGIGADIAPDTRLVDFFEAALKLPAAAKQPAAACRVSARLAVGLLSCGGSSKPNDVARHAEQLARSLSPGPIQDVCLARSLWARSLTGQFHDSRAERDDCLRQLVELGSQIERPDLVLIGHAASAVHSLTWRDYEGATAECAAMEALAAKYSWPRYLAHSCALRASIALEQGDGERAAVLSAAGQRHSQASRYVEGETYVQLGQLVCKAWHQRTLGEFVDVLREAAGPEQPAVVTCALAAAQAELGAGEAASASVVDRLGADLALLPYDSVYGASLAFLATTAFDSKNTKLAQLLAPRLEPLVGTNIVAGAGIGLFGPAEGLLARVHAVLGSTKLASDYADAALRTCAEMGAVSPRDRLAEDAAAFG